MRDQDDNRLYKWKIDYATRGGDGTATCRDLDCLERHDQAGLRRIEKGCLRIARRVLMDAKGAQGEAGGHVEYRWHHARCMFHTFTRSRKNTRIIESPEDLEGFEKIDVEDQAMIRRLIHGEDIKGGFKPRVHVNKGKKGAGTAGASGTAGVGGAGGARTPEEGKKRTAGDAFDGERMTFAPSNRDLPEYRDIVIAKGYRVWTHCKVKPPPPPPGTPIGPVFGIKSPKPELGMIVEDERDGSVIIQFESAAHEKEREEKYTARKYRNNRAWIRYPRVFEGSKQRIPASWIVKNRAVPPMCSCKVQEWAHQCECSGISCGRGVQRKVWGVCQ